MQYILTLLAIYFAQNVMAAPAYFTVTATADARTTVVPVGLLTKTHGPTTTLHEIPYFLTATANSPVASSPSSSTSTSSSSSSSFTIVTTTSSTEAAPTSTETSAPDAPTSTETSAPDAPTSTETSAPAAPTSTETSAPAPTVLSTSSTSSTSSSSSTSTSSSTTTSASSTVLSSSTSSTSSTSTSTSSTSTSSSSTSSTSSSTTTSASSTVLSSSVASTSALTSFESDILDAHNQKRALHGVPALKWNAKIAAYAAAYAAVALDCNNLQLVHSGGPYGENLAAGYVGGYSPVDAWYNEIKLYNYSQPGFSPATGHFTQVVWKSTTELGCAMLLCNNAWRQYTICEYTNTRGNIVGTNPATGNNFFVDNVLPPLDGNYIHKRNVFT